MHVLASVLLVLFVIVVFILMDVAVTQNEEPGMFLSFFIGLLLLLVVLVVLAFSPNWNPSGLPLQDIDPGTYKVGFVYVAGDNVNVAVEWKVDEKASEKIYHYQFKKDAFEGVLNPNAKKLVVVKAGSFKKLRLE